MSSFSLLRTAALGTLLATTFLVGPMVGARAADAVATPVPGAAAKGETIEQRITSLRASLKITADEDANWNKVAQAMRDNEAAMQKLAATRTTQAPQSMTAPQDLKAYQAFAQAHVDGVKNLISSFDVLYAAMPDAQKKVADQVFMQFGRPTDATHS
jgi:leucyl aminopeptidase (aminopeptidase T)